MMVLTLSGSKVDEITFFADPRRCPAASVFPETHLADKDGFDVKWTPPLRGHFRTLAQTTQLPSSTTRTRFSLRGLDCEKHVNTRRFCCRRPAEVCQQTLP